jgi:hypothetical protein
MPYGIPSMKMRIPNHRRASHVAARIYLVFCDLSSRVRKNNPIAFEVLIVLAIAHLFGFYNPKQLADFLDIPHQKLYSELKDWRVYHVKKMLLRFMVKKAAEELKPGHLSQKAKSS